MEYLRGIMLNPVLPFITDNEEDIRKLVRLASENGAKFIHTYMGMTLRDIQREYYFSKLDENFEGIKQKYIMTYGNKYNCMARDYGKLYEVFKEECEKYDILYKMKDIIKAYKKSKRKNDLTQQISFFND